MSFLNLLTIRTPAGRRSPKRIVYPLLQRVVGERIRCGQGVVMAQFYLSTGKETRSAEDESAYDQKLRKPEYAVLQKYYEYYVPSPSDPLYMFLHVHIHLYE